MKIEELEKLPENIGKRSDGTTYLRDWRWRGVFLGKCDKCGKEFKIRTQEDNNPEYYAEVYVEHCPDEYTHFSLPVN